MDVINRTVSKLLEEFDDVELYMFGYENFRELSEDNREKFLKRFSWISDSGFMTVEMAIGYNIFTHICDVADERHDQARKQDLENERVALCEQIDFKAYLHKGENPYF